MSSRPNRRPMNNRPSGCRTATNPGDKSVNRSTLLALFAVILLSACATTQRPLDQVHPRLKPAPAATDADADAVVFGEEESDNAFGADGPELFAGDGELLNRAAAARRPPPVSTNGQIVLNFEGESVQSVVHTILGEVLQETFVIAPGVSGQVTFATSKPVDRDQLLPILELLLRWNGSTLVFHEGRYHVLPLSEAIPGHLVPRLGDVDAVKGYEVQVVPLEYIAAPEMAKILEPYVRPDAIVNVDALRGMLFLAGTREELRNYLQTVEIFDVDWLAGMSVGIFPLQTVDIESITAELGAIFGAEGEGDNPLAGMFRFVPMERLESIMVITPREEYLAKAEQWITRLDRGAAGGGQQLFVYRVKNLEAGVLAGYLSELFGGRSANRDRARGNNLAPGLRPVTRSSVGDFNGNRNAANNQGRERSNAPNRDNNGGGLLGEDANIAITAVVETNSLLIQATQSEYGSILAAIERIDEEPLQVLIEAQVMDVQLTDSLQYGVNWFLSNFETPDSDLFPGSGRLFDQGASDGTGLTLSLSDMLFGDDTFVAATITALDSVTDVRSLAAPSLVVRNNEAAVITVGTQVPVVSSSISPISDTVVSSAQYIDTGVTLDVTPRINPGGLVYLDIKQSISAPGAPLPDFDSPNPPINNREIDSKVAVQSGDTVFLGGLIRESESATTGGVPFLSRIPGLGALFGTQSQDKSRTETIVMITPTVLENSADLRAVTDDLKDEFIRVEPLKIHTIQGNPANAGQEGGDLP